MIDVLRRNPVIAALAIACAALVAVVAFELLSPTTASSASARKTAAAEAKLLPPVATVGVDQVYPETVNRPLWIPTRRPAPTAVATPAASFPKGQYILQGVIVAGGTRTAMLKEKTSGRIHRVEKGRDVNGIQVAEIEAESVTLAQGDEREVIELRVQRPGGPGAPPPPAPVAASTAGPFGSPAHAPQAAPAQPVPGVTTSPAPNPVAPPAGSPFGSVPRPPQVGPLSPQPANSSNPPAAAAPQDASSTPMTPEELLARRRARRNQSP